MSSEHGRFVALDDQDRTLWDRGRIDEGSSGSGGAAAPAARPGAYQLQAAIAALHATAPAADDTDWRADRRALRRARATDTRRPSSSSTARSPSACAGGPQAGLALLDRCSATLRSTRYAPLHAAHAELLRRAGDVEGRHAPTSAAIALSANAVERTELEERLGALR